MDLTGYWPDIGSGGRLYSGSDSSSTAVGVPLTPAMDLCTRPHRAASPVQLPMTVTRGHPLACRTGTMDSQYASMSTTTSTASASSNVDDDDVDDDDDDDDVTPSPDDVMRFIESPV